MSVLRCAAVWSIVVLLSAGASHLLAASIPTTGQVLHLDASDASSFTLSGSNVVTWADLSTSGNDASQLSTSLQPTRVSAAMNGLPVVRFDGTDDYLGLLSTMNLTGGMELFVVAQNVNSGDFIANGWQHSTPGGGFRIQGNNGGNLSVQFGASVATLPSAVTSPYSELVGLTYDDGSDDYALRRTGELASSITGGNNYNVNSANFSKIGASNNNTGDVIFPLDGDIAEILIYDQPLSVSDRQFVEASLAYKWGLQNQLPVDHPYFGLSSFPPPIPEPATFWLLGSVLGVATLRRRKKAGV